MRFVYPAQLQRTGVGRDCRLVPRFAGVSDVRRRRNGSTGRGRRRTRGGYRRPCRRPGIDPLPQHASCGRASGHRARRHRGEGSAGSGASRNRNDPCGAGRPPRHRRERPCAGCSIRAIAVPRTASTRHCGRSAGTWCSRAALCEVDQSTSRSGRPGWRRFRERGPRRLPERWKGAARRCADRLSQCAQCLGSWRAAHIVALGGEGRFGARRDRPPVELSGIAEREFRD